MINKNRLLKTRHMKEKKIIDKFYMINNTKIEKIIGVRAEMNWQEGSGREIIRREILHNKKINKKTGDMRGEINHIQE